MVVWGSHVAFVTFLVHPWNHILGVEVSLGKTTMLEKFRLMSPKERCRERTVLGLAAWRPVVRSWVWTLGRARRGPHFRLRVERWCSQSFCALCPCRPSDRSSSGLRQRAIAKPPHLRCGTRQQHVVHTDLAQICAPSLPNVFYVLAR